LFAYKKLLVKIHHIFMAEVMSNRTICITDELYDYLVSVSLRESELLKRLRGETVVDEMSRMQISPEQGQFMSMLIRLIGAKKALEVGVYTGYSSLCIALAMHGDGQLVACDINEQWTAVAKRYWQEAGVSDKIDLRLGLAVDTLMGLLASGEAGSYDFAFIDADKKSYETYYELCLELLRAGGLIAIDNVLWGGAVADEDIMDEDTQTIRKLNKFILGDKRVEISLVPIGDGLTLARKV